MGLDVSYIDTGIHIQMSLTPKSLLHATLFHVTYFPNQPRYWICTNSARLLFKRGQFQGSFSVLYDSWIIDSEYC